MEWLSKLPQWVKIPLKIFLPGMTIFSGLIMFSNDNLLEKLYLLEFRENNGFVFGLLFTICISLIIVYIIYFVYKKMNKVCDSFFLERKYYKLFNDLADVYKKQLILMYKSPTHSLKMDMNNSVTSYLEAIHAIGRSNISVMHTMFDYYLQPWVEKSIQRLCNEIDNKIIKARKKARKLCNETEINKINDEIKKIEEFLLYVNTPLDMDNDDNYY